MAIIALSPVAFAAGVMTLTPQNDGSVHMGVASCYGSTCHSRQEATGQVVRQNEVSTWQDQTSTTGAHLRAYKVLFSNRSIAIGQRLGIGTVHEAKECLACHSSDIPPARQAAKFQFDDGIGCENCHGGSEDWLASHYAEGATHAQSVSLGLYALEDPDVRATVCLSCHVGSTREGQFVSHRLMAAGHPRMSFELDLFTALQRHHDEDVDYYRRKTVSTGAQIWAVGQARSLEQQLMLFADPALNRDGIFPEPVFFECRSCHIQIFDDPEAQPMAAVNPGRPSTPGQIRFNDAHMIMLLAIAQQIDPNIAAELDTDIRAFHAALSGEGDVSSASEALRAQTAKIGSLARDATFDRDKSFGLLNQVMRDVLTERYTDYVAAEQAIMAVDTLLSSMVAARQVALSDVTALRDSVEAGYAAVEDANLYDQTELVAALRDLQSELGQLQ